MLVNLDSFVFGVTVQELADIVVVARILAGCRQQDTDTRSGSTRPAEFMSLPVLLASELSGSGRALGSTAYSSRAFGCWLC